MKKTINEDLPESIADYWGVTDENIIEITKLPNHSWPYVLRKVANDLERIDRIVEPERTYSSQEMIDFALMCGKQWASEESALEPKEILDFYKATFIPSLPAIKKDK